MDLVEKIIQGIEKIRDSLRKKQSGAIGQFWRDGGNALLYELPVTTGTLVIDAGGYEGEWAAGMIARYGCHIALYEPVPTFADHCHQLFHKNDMVNVHKSALGGSERTTVFNLLDNGTSEFRAEGAEQIEAKVEDVAKVFDKLSDTRIACLKLNIEGGEYEVLERLLETDKIAFCDSLLIQFHRQPSGYQARYEKIIAALEKTHVLSWRYEMVWEQWVLK